MCGNLKICRICERAIEEKESSTPFNKWVRPTFNDHDKLYPGNVICNGCLFWFDEKSELLMKKVGKDKPQKMRNYGHFIVDGEWIPLSKGQKSEMARLLLSKPFPELAVIPQSGQKHIAFVAPRNEAGSTCGWVQFETERLFVEPEKLEYLLGAIEQLLDSFSKAEIENFSYNTNRILKFGISKWKKLEDCLRTWRGSQLFYLAVYLSQKKKEKK